MKGEATFKRSTGVAQFDVWMSVELLSADEFELTADPPFSIPDWGRYLVQIREGICEALLDAGKDIKVRATVQVVDNSKKTPPIGYKFCAKAAVANAYES